MANINDLKTKLTSIADSIREKLGSSDRLTLEEMRSGVDFMPSSADDNAFILVDEYGNEIPAVLTKHEVELTASANDIRLGYVAITDKGLITGEKDIPAYHTYEGYRAVSKNSEFILPHDDYDYTKLQAIFCLFNTNTSNSTAAIKVSIANNVYDIASNVPVSAVRKDHDRELIDFGLTNDTGKNCIIRYIMYKEIY